jgi:hypothetical protein
MPTPRVFLYAGVLLAVVPLTLRAQGRDTVVKVDTIRIPSISPDSTAKLAAAGSANRSITALTNAIADLKRRLPAPPLEGKPPISKENQQLRRDLYSRVTRTSNEFLYTMVIGTTATFTGSGIFRQELTYQQETSPWQSTRIRNTFDKTKPWSDALGAVALGLASVSSSNGNSSSARGFGIGGGAALAVGAILKAILGTNEDKVLKTAGAGVNSLQAQIAPIYLSRQAFDEIKIRQALANKYYASASTLLDSLTSLRDQLSGFNRKLEDSTTLATADSIRSFNGQLAGYIDRLFETVTSYEGVVSFLEEYTTGLSISYAQYSQAFPSLAPQLTKAKSQVDEFQERFTRNIRGPWLDKLPKYRVALADLRIEIKRE